MITIYTINNSDLAEFRKRAEELGIETPYREVPNEGLSTTGIYFDNLPGEEEYLLEANIPFLLT